MTNLSVVGFWKFKSNQVKREDGAWYTEQLFGGTMAFSASGEVCLFVRSDQGPWGYAGQYIMEGDRLKVKVEACSAPDVEGGMLERKVRFINENELVFSGLESHTSRPFQTHFTRCL